MNWMYHGMKEGESRKSVLQESWGSLGGIPHIMVEWKEGSMDEGLDVGEVCKDCLDGDRSLSGSPGLVHLVEWVGWRPSSMCVPQ
jgi:hypothetical protein